MALFENIFELAHSSLGMGGGLVAGEIYRRFRNGVKDAAAAKSRAAALGEELKAAVKEIKAYAEDRFVTKEEVARLIRGSRPEFPAATKLVVLRRLDELERRVSGIEDDLDNAKKEDRAWAEQIRETMGRIEGQLSRK